MDGVMIDSEPIWQLAQINTLNNLGITITATDCEQYTMEKRIDLIAKTWCELYNLHIDQKVLVNDILEQVVQNIKKNGKEIKGLKSLLDFLTKEKFKIGLATSSSWGIIDAVSDKLSLRNYFHEICSADDEKYGKPNPAVYIKVMEKLNSKPEECFILEDSVRGIIAAKASMAHTIVLTSNISNPNFAIANYRSKTLEDIIEYIT